MKGKRYIYIGPVGRVGRYRRGEREGARGNKERDRGWSWSGCRVVGEEDKDGGRRGLVLVGER